MKDSVVRLSCGGLWAAACLCLLPLQAADWPGFRGQSGSGTSEGRSFPVEFGPDRSVVWKTDLPPGKSSPVLAAGRVFLTANEDERLITFCVDRETGEILWQREVIREREDKRSRLNGPAAPTPITDGKSVYVFFADFGLIAYDLDGNELWKKPLGPFQSEHGMVASPVLDAGKLLLVADLMYDSFVAAFDTKDGNVLWKVKRRDTLGGYATPVVYRPADGPSELVVPGPFELSAYDTENGERLWWMSGLAHQPKSLPVVHDDTVYVNVSGLLGNYPPYEKMLERFDENSDGAITQEELGKFGWVRRNFAGFDLNRNELLDEEEWSKLLATESALWAVEFGGQNDVTQTHVRWNHKKSLPNVPSPLIYDDVLYLVRNGGILTTLDPATGEVLKQGRIREAIDSYYSSPVAGDGKVYVASETGKVSVIRAGSQWEVLAVHDFGEEIYATPALGEGRIYLRTTKALYCLEEPALVTSARKGDIDRVRSLLAENKFSPSTLNAALAVAERTYQPEIEALLSESGAERAEPSGDGGLRIPQDVLASYAGEYQHENGWKMRFIFEEGLFLFQRRDGDQVPVPVSRTTFRMPGRTPWTVEFHVEEGKATSITSTWRDQSEILKRVEDR